jgi:hypothetical protein
VRDKTFAGAGIDAERFPSVIRLLKLKSLIKLDLSCTCHGGCSASQPLFRSHFSLRLLDSD